MTVAIRKAIPEDSQLLVDVIDMASAGVVPAIWGAMAPEGLQGADIGRALVCAEAGDFSYRNGTVLDRDGAAVAGLIGYPLREAHGASDVEIPEAFVGVARLTDQVLGYWYINVMAVLPGGRRQGLGASLLAAAEAQARESGCPGLALVVAASNGNAISLYRRSGFSERARCPFDLSEFGEDPTDAILMVKDFA